MGLIVGIYLLAGVVFGVYCVFQGFKTIDASAEGTGLAVRMLWFPAAVLLWPVLIKRAVGTSDA